MLGPPSLYRPLLGVDFERERIETIYFRHPVAGWLPRDLPQTPNADGRPVWEPPVLNFTYLIGEEYEKKAEAVMKHYRNDAAKATTSSTQTLKLTCRGFPKND